MRPGPSTPNAAPGRAARGRNARFTDELRATPLVAHSRASPGRAHRRQVPLLGRFSADFAAPARRVLVEVDGEYHGERAAADARRFAAGRGGHGQPLDRVLRSQAASRAGAQSRGPLHSLVTTAPRRAKRPRDSPVRDATQLPSLDATSP